jgi:hypothetical protein
MSQTKTNDDSAQTSTLTAREKQLQKELRDAKKKAEDLEMKLSSVDRGPQVQESSELTAIVENLQAQIEQMKTSQAAQPVIVAPDGKKEKYRPVTPQDIAKDGEAVTFYARCAFKVVSGYTDEKGMEVFPPHKLIKMNFAASDIRQDGKESEVLIFCSYTTKLQSEIDFMRNHPEYGIVITEGMKEAAGHSVKEYQFKTKAAEQVASMSPESIIDYARMLKIPNYTTMRTRELKTIIVQHMVGQFLKEQEALTSDLQARMLLQAKRNQQIDKG